LEGPVWALHFHRKKNKKKSESGFHIHLLLTCQDYTDGHHSYRLNVFAFQAAGYWADRAS